MRADLSRFSLKLAAVAAMVVDHTGAALITAALLDGRADAAQSLMFMRLIGRLAFPIFAFLVAEGCAHTRSMPRYLARLGIFAALAQPAFMLFLRGLQGTWPRQASVMLTLALGAFCVLCWQWLFEAASPWARVSAVGAIALALAVGAAAQSEFSPLGAAAVLVFYALRPKGQDDADRAVPGSRTASVFAGMGLLAVQAVLMGYEPVFTLAVAAAAVPLALYDGRPGLLRGKWFFYAFYPAHLFVLGAMLLPLWPGWANW